MDDIHFLAAAYILGLVLFLAYLFMLDNHQKTLHKQLEHLDSVVCRLKEKEEPKEEEPEEEMDGKPPQTIIYDQRNIEISDSVFQRTDFGHKIGEDEEKEPGQE
jgi:hypothetical protein